MFTALIGLLSGVFTGVVPEIIGFFKRREERLERQADRAHELLIMDKQIQQMQATSAAKMEEVRITGAMDALRGEMAAQTEQMKAIYESAKPVGVKWVDAWNAALRPACISIVLLVFGTGCTLYMTAAMLLWWNGTIDMVAAADMLFRGLVGEAIQAVLGYLLGYRGTLRAAEWLNKR